MTPDQDRNVTAQLTPADLRVWACLDREEWRNREDIAPLANVTEDEAEQACTRFTACGLVVRRQAYPDFRYRLTWMPSTDRGRLLLAKLQAAMRAEAVV